MTMTRDEAIDNIMEAYLALADSDKYKFLSSKLVSDQAELALGALGVTDDELNAWGARTIRQMREENYNVGIPTPPEAIVTHFWGHQAQSPCGRDVGSVYYGVKGHSYTSEWSKVDCAKCLEHKP